MRKKSFINPYSVAIALTILLYACSKEGDQGPAGPAGPAGATGAAGTKGDPGTANVIYSAWLDVTYLPDTIHTGALIDTLGYYADIPASTLTNAILTSGEMKVYLNLGTAATPFVVPLPYVDLYQGITITPTFFLQTIELYSNIPASTITTAPKRLQYRYILIPGGVAGRTANKINWNNYAEVKAYLGLKD